jgi:hypothetical protein
VRSAGLAHIRLTISWRHWALIAIQTVQLDWQVLLQRVSQRTQCIDLTGINVFKYLSTWPGTQGQWTSTQRMQMEKVHHPSRLPKNVPREPSEQPSKRKSYRSPRWGLVPPLGCLETAKLRVECDQLIRNIVRLVLSYSTYDFGILKIL